MMQRRVLLAVLIILVVIQLFRPDKNQTQAVQISALKAHYAVPADVEQSLNIACYDCHSNNTRYPWYFHIQPVAWWMADHVHDGKRHLNFDEFAAYPLKKQVRKLEGTMKSQQDDWMPISSYLWIHHQAKLNEHQRARIVRWADSLSKVIQKQLPSATK